MTLLPVCHALVYLGDGAVLLPCAALLFAWLVAVPATRRTAWRWLGAVLLVAGGTAFGKLLYMLSGWHPAGWNFIGPSGHASLSALVLPSAAALALGRDQPALRMLMVILCGALALGIALSSWALSDHSFSEVAIGALWGAIGAATFLATSWHQGLRAPVARHWMVASLLLCVMLTYENELPSTRVLGWVASGLDSHTTIRTRADLGPQAQLSKAQMDEWETRSTSKREHRRENP